MTFTDFYLRGKGFSLYLAVFMALGLQGCGSSGSDKPGLTISQPTVVEGDADTVELIFTVTLSEEAEDSLTLDYTTSDNTATVADGDYVAASGSVSIAKGANTASISVFANGDEDYESNETFNLIVSNAQGVKLDESSYSGQGLIENDDDAEPEGYFAGSATIDSVALNDVKALAHHDDNRILIISPTANVLYDIHITDITVNDFTGDVDVYVNGAIEQVAAVTVTGTTDKSSLQGSFSGGTGLAVGSFNLTFDVNNNEGASLARIETFIGKNWAGIYYSVDSIIGNLGFNDVGIFGGGNNNSPICQVLNGVTAIPSAQGSIYKLSNEVTQAVNCHFIGTDFTGYGAVIDDVGTDDSLVYAVANGTFSLFSVFTRDP